MLRLALACLVIALAAVPALSALAGALLHHGTGPMPLILLMLASSALSILSTLWVMLRARQIA